MSPKLLRQIIAILLGVIIGWGLLASWQRQRRQADSQHGIMLPALASSSTDTIRYAGSGDSVVLARGAAGWTANGKPAAQPVIEAFFRALADSSTRSELIAESAASHGLVAIAPSWRRRVSP